MVAEAASEEECPKKTKIKKISPNFFFHSKILSEPGHENSLFLCKISFLEQKKLIFVFLLLQM